MKGAVSASTLARQTGGAIAASMVVAHRHLLMQLRNYQLTGARMPDLAMALALDQHLFVMHPRVYVSNV
jgi:hypothetical protein